MKKWLVIFLCMGSVVTISALDSLQFLLFGNTYVPVITVGLQGSTLSMRELVFKDSESDDLISELNWNLGFQFGANLGVWVRPVDIFNKFGVEIGGDVTWYFPASGDIEDTDWDNAGDKYSFGKSIATTLSALDVTGTIGVIIPFVKKFTLEIGAEVWYSRFATIAHDGWKQQVTPGDPWNPNAPKERLYGTSVSYIQEWITFAPSVGFRMNMKKSEWGIKVAVSPLIWGYHIDNHYFRKLEAIDDDQRYIIYEDQTRGKIYYRLKGEYFWHITPRFDVGLTVEYKNIPGSRGDTTTKTTGLAGYIFRDKGMAGAEIRSFKVGLLVRTSL